MRIDTLPFRLLAAAGFAVALTGDALAGMGQPSPWQLGMQTPAAIGAEAIHDFHDLLLWIITVIVLFVLALLIYVIVRFSETRNQTPSRTTHNSLLEVAWTLVPVLILVVIAVPSFRLLKAQLVIPTPDVVVKATGHQWYWSYEYPADQGGFSFDSNLAADKQPRLLAVDNELVVPVDKIVKVQVTAADVIHAFAMPSFGLKIDAIPGRLNETWFKADKEGVFYGQCSLICGQNHAFMPIMIRVVSQEAYTAWLADAKKKFAANPSGPIKLADRDAITR
ncbi:cytochrome c oxidase subunit II [Chelatococcus reniformis]|uniref:Cytochrome c oxidase subunit 2 n=1 Tax=Chelatococcus reniformis TaxID=1494448 RepID=A0A916XC09_9HYPH|nr:cytochrome c oxidase subunit 2 [Chelatococcus reniformis]